MSGNQHRRERERSELRAGTGIKALLIWGAVGLMGSGMLYGILMSLGR